MGTEDTTGSKPAMTRLNASPFNVERFETLRAARRLAWGQPLHASEIATSTNDLALAAARDLDAAPTGSVWVTGQQSQGRGRRGNRWQAAAGDALLMSLLLRWAAPRETLRGLPLTTGLAVRTMVEEFSGARAQVKWPNDVLVADRKIAGILVETRRSVDQQLAVVIGIGVNIRTREFPEEIGPATSLAQLGARGEQLQLETCLATLLTRLQEEVQLLLRHGTAGVSMRVSEHDALLGRRIALEGAQSPDLPGATQELVGTARGIDGDGHLRVELDTTETVAIESAHLRLLDRE